MAHEVKLTMDAMLINWLKSVGDTVSAGDIIAEFEADKATVEVEAGTDGTILQLNGESGAELDEGTIIALIGSAGEAPANGNGKSQSAPKQSAPTSETEAVDEIIEKEASKAPATPAPANGSSVTDDGRLKVSPLARKIAEDKGVNLAQVSGTGPGGRIVKKDVEEFTPSTAQPTATPSQSAPSAINVSHQTWGKLPEGDDYEIIDVSRMRRLIAEGTINSKSNIPHFYVTVELDVEALLNLRKRLNDDLADEGVKISVNDMIMKAAAIALKKFPNLNTHFYGDKLVRHKRINIGVSVALPNNGLVNVVNHDTDKITLSELAISNKAMYERAREGKIKPEDVKGATFTISNLGPYNVESFSAIISAPEAAMLAVSSSRKIPVVLDDGSIGVGTRMKMTLSVDHRVSDGAEGAEYMNHLRGIIENPMRLLI